MLCDRAIVAVIYTCIQHIHVQMLLLLIGFILNRKQGIRDLNVFDAIYERKKKCQK